MMMLFFSSSTNIYIYIYIIIVVIFFFFLPLSDDWMGGDAWWSNSFFICPVALPPLQLIYYCPF